MSTSFYDISIWEEIRSIVSWKTDRLVENINNEISKDSSLAEFQGKHPVPFQLREIMEQRANAWVQRLYDPCCDAYKSRGKTLSVEFERAVWFYRVEPFIMGETDSQIHSGTMGGFLNLLLCAVGSPPERRPSLTVSQKQCCFDVRAKVHEFWHDKLHHLPPRINEAAAAMAQANARDRRAARIVAGLPADDPPTPPATRADPLTQPEESPRGLPPEVSPSKTGPVTKAPPPPSEVGGLGTIHGPKPTEIPRDLPVDYPSQAGETNELSLTVCAVCGHYEAHHDQAGCFLDPHGRSSQDPGILSRPALKKTGALCWCPKFLADFSQAADLIYESGNCAALKHGTAEAITRGDSRNARRLLDRLIIKTTPVARDLDWIKAVERSIAAIEPAVPSSGTVGSTKPGRALARSPDFVNLAGKLWLNALGQSGNASVTAEHLKQIASRLDEGQYVPPAEYLEDSCARELKAFNSKNSHSKIGPIQTWSGLVTFGDKDHLRGMRRLLSRCAQKQPL